MRVCRMWCLQIKIAPVPAQPDMMLLPGLVDDEALPPDGPLAEAHPDVSENRNAHVVVEVTTSPLQTGYGTAGYDLDPETHLDERGPPSIERQTLTSPQPNAMLAVPGVSVPVRSTSSAHIPASSGGTRKGIKRPLQRDGSTTSGSRRRNRRSLDADQDLSFDSFFAPFDTASRRATLILDVTNTCSGNGAPLVTPTATPETAVETPASFEARRRRLQVALTCRIHPCGRPPGMPQW